MYQQFESNFESIGTKLPMCEALEQKRAQKTKSKARVLSLVFIPFDSSRRASHFSVFVCQNWMKNGQVMTLRSAHAKVALAYFGPKMAILATFCEI